MKYSVVSLFAGVGGIELGFAQTGKTKTLWANEWDSKAAETYSANFNNTINTNDIHTIRTSDVPNANILLSGFPCQAFSVAGYQKGFEDERGDLFFETLRFIKDIKPDVIFLENVKNLVSHDNGNTFKVIREALHYHGYYFKFQVLNAKDYGNIPQNRERIYIVGFKDQDHYRNFEFPGPIPLTTKLQDIIDFENTKEEKYYYSKEKTSFYNELEKEIKENFVIYQWRRKYVRQNKSGVVPTLTANMGMGGHNVPLILSNNGIRKLLPRECFNAQGFPRNFILPTTLSDSALYKQAGNSVVVPVIKRIADNIFYALEGSKNLNKQLDFIDLL